MPASKGEEWHYGIGDARGRSGNSPDPSKIFGRNRRREKRPSFEAILVLAEALGTSEAAFFEFDKKGTDQKASAKRLTLWSVALGRMNFVRCIRF
jgi:hypothetical protein